MSAVIVLWNSKATIEECLKCLGEEFDEIGRKDTELLVVDNASTDTSIDSVSRGYPAARILRNQRNLGFGAAVNRAVAQARGDLVLILNPDAFLQLHSLVRLVDTLKADPHTGIVGPALRNREGIPDRSGFREPTWWSELLDLFHLSRLFSVSGAARDVARDGCRSVEMLEGSCLLVRKDIFQTLGGFDESFFMYSEEWDLCVRARTAGWKIAWEPRAEVIHIGGVSTGQRTRKMFQELYRSKVLFFRKHGGRWRAMAYKLGLYMVALSRLPAAALGPFDRTGRRSYYQELSGRHLELLKNLRHF